MIFPKFLYKIGELKKSGCGSWELLYDLYSTKFYRLTVCMTSWAGEFLCYFSCSGTEVLFVQTGTELNPRNNFPYILHCRHWNKNWEESTIFLLSDALSSCVWFCLLDSTLFHKISFILYYYYHPSIKFWFTCSLSLYACYFMGELYQQQASSPVTSRAHKAYPAGRVTYFKFWLIVGTFVQTVYIQGDGLIKEGCLF